MPIIDFEEKISIRVKSSVIKELEAVLKVNKDKYYNLSHFIRCGMIKLLNEEKEAIKRNDLEEELNRSLIKR